MTLRLSRSQTPSAPPLVPHALCRASQTRHPKPYTPNPERSPLNPEPQASLSGARAGLSAQGLEAQSSLQNKPDRHYKIKPTPEGQLAKDNQSSLQNEPEP